VVQWEYIIYIHYSRLVHVIRNLNDVDMLPGHVYSGCDLVVRDKCMIVTSRDHRINGHGVLNVL
jgi:hypothetical protein